MFCSFSTVIMYRAQVNFCYQTIFISLLKWYLNWYSTKKKNNNILCLYNITARNHCGCYCLLMSFNLKSIWYTIYLLAIILTIFHIFNKIRNISSVTTVIKDVFLLQIDLLRCLLVDIIQNKLLKRYKYFVYKYWYSWRMSVKGKAILLDSSFLVFFPRVGCVYIITICAIG